MSIKRIIIMSFLLFMIIVVISSCAKPYTKLEIEEKIVIHPELPRPVSTINLDWKIIIMDEGIIVGLVYDDFMKHIEYISDIVRYIEQSRNVICFYRMDLKESFCVKKVKK